MNYYMKNQILRKLIEQEQRRESERNHFLLTVDKESERIRLQAIYMHEREEFDTLYNYQEEIYNQKIIK